MPANTHCSKSLLVLSILILLFKSALILVSSYRSVLAL